MRKGQDRKKLRLFLATAIIVIAIDQLSKLWVRANSPQIELIPGFLNLVHVENYGLAFGLLANQTFLLIIISVASLLIVLLFLHYLPSATVLSVISIGLVFGGAIGNLIDRLHLGYVIDFIDIHLQELFHWYTFNVADTAITIGILTLIYSLYRSGLFSKAYEHDQKAGS